MSFDSDSLWLDFLHQNSTNLFRSVFKAKFSSPQASADEAITQENYLISRIQSPQELLLLFIRASRERRCLVLLPQGTEEERKTLLSLLPRRAPSRAALAIFTSGSSGQPKAVFHQTSALLQTAQEVSALLQPYEFSVPLLAPWSMAGLVFHFLAPHFGRHKCGFVGESPLFWEEALPIAEEGGPDLVVGSPFLLESLLRKQTWKGTFFSFTAPLKPAIREKAKGAGIDLVEGYGLSELGGPVILQGESIGPTLSFLGGDELAIDSPRLALGYGSGEETFEPLSGPFPSGDVFQLQENKWSWVTRKKEWLDLGTRKVAPGLIESVVEAFPEVNSALVQMVEGSQEWRICYLASKEGKALGSRLEVALQSQAFKSLSVDSRPRVWREVEEIPRLPSGKAKRWINSLEES
jgi:acyl-coenzyme A synthetase/AMP-(fatty) acid ligase